MLSKFLPFMPVDKAAMDSTSGKTIENRGPDILTSRDITNLKLVLTRTKRTRAIVSIAFVIGKMQGLVLEQLPPNLFTLTRDQVGQLKIDNVLNQTHLRTTHC